MESCMATYKFSSVTDIIGVPAPTDKASVEVWHETLVGFGCRIGRPRADGKVRRTYLARFDVLKADGSKSNEKVPLGLVADIGTGDPVLTYEQASTQATDMVRNAKTLARGGVVRMTVGQAYEALDAELKRPSSADAPSYAKRLRETYRRFLSHLNARYLDELDEAFWVHYVKELRDGTLDVGVELDKAGNPVRVLRHAASASYLLAVTNTASRLYRLADERKGLAGVEKKWDPTRNAAKKIEPPNVRSRYLEFPDIGAAWRATDQLMSPWWRDMYRVYLLTGLRDKLVMDMRWDQLDLNVGMYRILPLRPGAKRRRQSLSEKDRQVAIEMPLSTVVVDILRRRQEFAPKGEAGEWVWYSTDTEHRKSKTLPRLTDPRAAWKRLESRIGYWLYKHDLRRTFASIGATVDPVAALALSLLLMHSNKTAAQVLGVPQITVSYVKGQAGAMRSLTEAISQTVLQLAGEAPVTSLTQRMHEYMPLPSDVARSLEAEDRILGLAANDHRKAA